MGSREAIFGSREAIFGPRKALFGPREALFGPREDLFGYGNFPMMGYKCLKKHPKIYANEPLKDSYDTVLGGLFLII